MNRTFAVIIALVVLAILMLYSMAIPIRFHEVAVRTRFGKVNESSVITEPGLNFKLPFFVDKVHTFDRRIQFLETPLDELSTADGQQIVLRAFLLWKVNDEGDGPLEFFNNYGTAGDGAHSALLDRFRSSVLTVVGRFTFDDLIGPRSRVSAVEEAIRQDMASGASTGIVPVSVGISQLLLPSRTTQSVMERMRVSRTTLSENERSKGNAIAMGINNRASAQADKIRAFAQQRADETRAAVNQQAATHMQTMSQDESLAIFLAWLDALEAGFSDTATWFFPADFAPLHLMNLNAPTGPDGIPQPTQTPGPETPKAPTKPSARANDEDEEAADRG